MTAPRYQEFPSQQIPVVDAGGGVHVKVIAGEIDGVRGPISQPATDPLYLDVALDAGATWSCALPPGHNAFAYVYEGRVRIGEDEDSREVAAQEMALLGGGDRLVVHSGTASQLIVVAGRPLGEPVARHGPFVMNTREELMQAFVDFQEGRF
jgi:redox-sensitive bicupin YhaK (pirin superfamily)